MINNTLVRITGTCYIVYMDDILVFSKYHAIHKLDLLKFLNALSTRKLNLKISKCELFKSEVTFLSGVILGNGHAICLDKLLAVLSWGTPHSKTEIKSFMGSVNFLWRFIKIYLRFLFLWPISHLLKSLLFRGIKKKKHLKK